MLHVQSESIKSAVGSTEKGAPVGKSQPGERSRCGDGVSARIEFLAGGGVQRIKRRMRAGLGALVGGVYAPGFLNLPRVFSERLALDTLQGGIGWNREGERIAITLEGLALANAKVSGNASGTYRTAAQGPGTIDLSVQLAKADVRDIYRYVPVIVPSAARERNVERSPPPSSCASSR